VIVPLAFGFLLSVWLVPVIGWIAHRIGAVAIPDHRTLHQGNIPRLGGVALGLTCLIGMVGLELWPIIEPEMYMFETPSGLSLILLAGAGGAMILGACDDIFKLSATFRLAAQVVLASIPVWAGLQFHYLPLPGEFSTLLLPGWLGSVLVILWIVFFINIFNFMDGIDGQALMAASITMLMLGTVCFALPTSETVIFFGIQGKFLAGFCFLVLGACGGVLCYNYPKASIFLGDGGSYFLGYILAFFPVYLTQMSVQFIQLPNFPPACFIPMNFLGILLALSPLLFDATFTLIKRAIRLENIMKPHREHLYQRLVLTGMPHRVVLKINLPYYLWNALVGLMVMRIPRMEVHWYGLGLSVISWGYYYLLVLYFEGESRRKSQS
jgi:UDP-GlcNAc:undecaprenyl-phosphate GlcNAc-1-phosphate transferase